jgi:uncharacterized membrane protein YkvA (DUF1232 family)
MFLQSILKAILWQKFAPYLLRLVRHGPDFFQLFGRLMRDRRVPWYVRWIPLAGITYAVFPVDAVFDLLVPWGWLDDIVVMYTILRLFIALCPRHVVREHVYLIDRK